MSIDPNKNLIAKGGDLEALCITPLPTSPAMDFTHLIPNTSVLKNPASQTFLHLAQLPHFLIPFESMKRKLYENTAGAGEGGGGVGVSELASLIRLSAQGSAALQCNFLRV